MRFISRHSLIISICLYGISLPRLDAAIVTTFNDVLIGGVSYDVTIHESGSFLTIWDPDRDGIFGESDGAVINHAPQFWGDFNAAVDAANAVMAAFGAVDTWDGTYDGIYIPYNYNNAANAYVGIVYDSNTSPGTDSLGGSSSYTGVLPTTDFTTNAWVSFDTASATEIPEPPFLLAPMMAGLLLLLGYYLRNRVQQLTSD